MKKAGFSALEKPAFHLRAAVEEKIGKLERYFNDSTEVHVTLSTEKNRQKIEVTVPMKGAIIRAEETSTDMYYLFSYKRHLLRRFPSCGKRRMCVQEVPSVHKLLLHPLV